MLHCSKCMTGLQYWISYPPGDRTRLDPETRAAHRCPSKGYDEMKHYEYGRVDLAEIELEARRMQAQAVANGVRSLAGWVRGSLKRGSQGHASSL